MIIKNNYDFFVWASDFEESRGEGKLSRIFFYKISEKYKKIFFIQTPGSHFFFKGKIVTKKKKNFSLNFYTKYLMCFYGIFLIWLNHLKGKKTIYLNYLPLWNFFIFFLLPSKTILGPITGGSYYFSVNFFNRFIRKIFFPIMYFISVNIIYFKYKKVIFATDLVKKFIPQFYLKNFIFNFVLFSFKENKSSHDRKIDFFIYYKNHSAKNPNFLKKIISTLKKIGLSVVVFGDNPMVKDVKYFSKLNKDQLSFFLKRSRFSIISNENFYSLFCMDCITYGVRVFFDERIKPNKFFFDKSYFIPIKSNNFNLAISKIKLIYFDYYSNFKYKKNIYNNNYLVQLKKINLFFSKSFFI
jgi:hypothetical protein